MEFFKNFFGGVLDYMYTVAGGNIGCILIYGAVSFAVCTIVSKKQMKNMYISAALRDTVREDKGKTGLYEEDLAAHALYAHGYSLFANIIVAIVQILFALTFTAGYSSEYFVNRETAIGKLELKENMMTMLSRGEDVYIAFILIGVIFLAKYAFAVVHGRKVAVDSSIVDIVLIVISLVCAFFIPSAFAVNIAITSACNLVYLLLCIYVFWDRNMEETRKTMGIEAEMFEVNLKMRTQKQFGIDPYENKKKKDIVHHKKRK